MFKKLYYAIAGDPNEKALKAFYPLVEKVNALEASFEAKSNFELRELTQQFRQKIQEATEETRDLLAEAEADYVAVLGTDEQKFARVEVTRIKKEMLEWTRQLPSSKHQRQDSARY